MIPSAVSNMNDKFQTNFNVTSIYDKSKPLQPVTKIGILPFIISSREHDDPAGDSACEADALETQGSERGTRVGTASPPIKFLVMKPRTEAKHLGAPAFQIAKGTRRININENWCDMREEDLRYADESFYETLLATALREGAEEVGLKTSNIKQLFDMGCFTFISASRGIVKPLHMFAAEIIQPDDFSAYEATTSEVRWMEEGEFVPIGRPDHVTIVQEILKRLENAFFAGI